MHSKIMIFCSILFTMFPMTRVTASLRENEYSIVINSFTENGSYIEYPQIVGLKDKEKQKSINDYLKRQVYMGAKDYLYEPFVDFSEPNVVYNYKVNVGFSNSELISFQYTFDAYQEYGWNTDRCYGVTFNMKTGDPIKLTEFMTVDERLFQITDGSGIPTDYDSVTKYVYYNLRDLYWVYTTPEEKDRFHNFSMQQMIDMLIHPEAEQNWYIDDDKKIVFSISDGSVAIPYDRLGELLNPEYLNMLLSEKTRQMPDVNTMQIKKG